VATPLNTFRTVTAELVDSDQVVYTAPLGITSIILMAQATNVDSSTAAVTFSHFETTNEIKTELVQEYPIIPNDAGGLITGKLVVEQNDQIQARATRSGALKLTLSVLESLNA